MPKTLESLPVLGLGASLSLSFQPNLVKLVNRPGGPTFVEHVELIDVEQVIGEVSRIKEAAAAILYHPSYTNFCGSYSNNAFCE